MGHYSKPDDAYWAFFETFNARDADGWAGVMSYPHVRVSPPREGAQPRTASRVFPTAGDYAAQASTTFERIAATGWVRTEGIEPELIHESDDRVHLAGGWTRYNAAGDPILSNRVAFVLTRLDEGWGIQARFGIDSWDVDADTSAQEQAARAVLGHGLDALKARNVDGFIDMFAFPLTEIRVGDVVMVERSALVDYPLPPVETAPMRVLAAGRTGVTAAVEARGPELSMDQLLLVTARAGEWGVQGLSMIRR